MTLKTWPYRGKGKNFETPNPSVSPEFWKVMDVFKNLRNGIHMQKQR